MELLQTRLTKGSFSFVHVTSLWMSVIGGQINGIRCVKVYVNGIDV
jgi:hypothetical protein